ncbi:TraR/DksA family transcriptional regulator [Zhengella sp. ZM62]|uniref:TraR/DksA family transcriptional regulator n=1 Tax=Zhengella sedimenti TaxID=3390035 RepID=UPI003976B6ED
MVDVAYFKNKLLARQAELRERLAEIEHDLDEPASADTEERATEREGDEVLESLGNQGMEELRRIDAALKRVEDGSYGDCVKCGEEISVDRLELLPATPFCRNCA